MLCGPYLGLGGLFPLPPPDNLPVLLGQFGFAEPAALPLPPEPPLPLPELPLLIKTFQHKWT